LGGIGLVLELINMQSGTILRHMHMMGARESNDEQLLHAFVEQRDESAFNVLVERHGPLVLRVCQSLLRHRQDAEDAFQAAFFVLARKAASVRKGEPLANWLYGVAYRLTMQVKRNAARRRVHETHVKSMPQRTALDELSWREVEAILHEEIDRLPTKYRDVFVLCGLGGVSRGDAARELGILEGTLSSRLAGARKLLQNRLTHRGVSLAAVLGVINVSQYARATIRLPLLQSTVKVAMSQLAKRAGVPCGVAVGVLTIIEGVERSMSNSKLKTTLASLLTVGLIAAGLGGLADHSSAGLTESTPIKSPLSSAEQPATNIARNDDAKSITVRGTVLGPDRKPVSGAKLYLGHYSPKDEITVTESTKSDRDGHFKFGVTKNLPRKTRPDQVVAGHPLRTIANFEPQPRDEADPYVTPVGQVMAVADGLGCDWVRINSESETAELTLQLVKDVPINGRILDKEGRPVVGAKLYLSSLHAYTNEDFNKALAQFPKSNSFPSGVRRWGGPLPGQARILTTGKDGTFSMTGLGGDRFAYLHIEGPGIESTDIQLLTRVNNDLVGPDKFILSDGTTVDAPRTPDGAAPAGGDTSIEPKRIYAATFRYLAAPSRLIRGVISDKETGKPLAGVLVGVGPNKGELHGRGMITARTDQDGRYEVQGCPKYPSYDIVAQPADTGQYFTILSSEIPDTPGLAPMSINLKLPRGIPVRGKVVDERTGKPVAGARVTYYAFANFAGATRLCADFDHAWTESSAIAGPDGSYSVAALPGEGFLGTVAPGFKNSGGVCLSTGYKRQELSDKELDDFIEMYKLPPPLDLPRRVKQNDIDLLYILTNYRNGKMVEGYAPAHFFNNLTLLHPNEKDKEVKLDLMLRPEAGEKAPVAKKGK
jgi:RNA polymerase sigma factor (sigma-70 family)